MFHSLVLKTWCSSTCFSSVSPTKKHDQSKTKNIKKDQDMARLLTTAGESSCQLSSYSSCWWLLLTVLATMGGVLFAEVKGSLGQNKWSPGNMSGMLSWYCFMVGNLSFCLMPLPEYCKEGPPVPGPSTALSASKGPRVTYDHWICPRQYILWTDCVSVHSLRVVYSSTQILLQRFRPSDNWWSSRCLTSVIVIRELVIYIGGWAGL